MSLMKFRRLSTMKRTTFSSVMLLMSLLLFAGCNSGGNSGGGGVAQQPTKATVKIAVAGTLPVSSTIGGVDLSLTLPTGVTVKSSIGSLSALVPDAGTVAASGVAASNSKVYAVYTAAARTVQGTVRILLANTTGFAAGEFVTVKCDIASGNTPTTTDFSTSGAKFVDGNGKAITGLSTTVTADFQ
jgi:hypothetical protein